VQSWNKSRYASFLEMSRMVFVSDGTVLLTSLQYKVNEKY